MTEDTRREDLAERLRRALEECERLRKERDQFQMEVILEREKNLGYAELKKKIADIAKAVRTIAEWLA